MIEMQGTPPQVIGKLSAARCLIPTIFLFLLSLMMLYFGYLHRFLDYFRGDMIASRPAAYVVSTLGFLYVFFIFLPYAFNVVVNRSVGLFVVDGNLIRLSPSHGSVAIADIVSMELGPDLVFEGVPSSIVLHPKEGRKISIWTIYFETPVPQMVASLLTLGVPLHGPAVSDTGS